MKKISNEGTLDGEIGPTTGILDLVKVHLKEREDYFNSKAHYRNIYDEQDSEFDLKKTTTNSKGKRNRGITKIRNQSTNSEHGKKSFENQKRCSIQQIYK